MSWGDPQTALNLNTDQNEDLSSLLLTVSGPSQVLLNDQKWQALLHYYNILVHLDEDRNALVRTVTESMARNAPRSGNLAALALHCARMLRDLSRSVDTQNKISPGSRSLAFRSRKGASTESLGSIGSASVMSAAKNNRRSNRNIDRASFILIGKARATCGALSLFKLCLHRTLLSGAGSALITAHDLERALIYTERDYSARNMDAHVNGSNGSIEKDSIHELLSSLIQFIITQAEPLKEIYDATIIALSLLLVMLSTQLYQPMLSSSQREEIGSSMKDHVSGQFNALFMDCLFSLKKSELENTFHSSHELPKNWEVSLLNTFLRWHINRPEPPPRTIAAHHIQFLKALIHSKGETPGVDGLYDNFRFVSAEAPQGIIERSLAKDRNIDEHSVNDELLETSSIITATTRGVMSLSSSLLLIPWKLMRHVLATIGNIGIKGYEYLGGNDDIQVYSGKTNDVLWLTESPLADLGSCIFLILAHNQRHDSKSCRNEFRLALSSLQDKRWEGHDFSRVKSYSFDSNDCSSSSVNFESDGLLYSDSFDPELGAISARHHNQFYDQLDSSLSINYESLFQSLGFTAHTELGALMLYTMMQSNHNFMASLAVRSDLDNIILPLLRTLYFASVIEVEDQSEIAGPVSSDESSSISAKPFRSSSHLYLVMILLLMFSQDASFGPDAFRRLMIENVLWYKERQLCNISLGSLIILCLLRSMTFNLSRLHDNFLLSNTLAVLMNISPHAIGVHSYAALRLVSVTLNCIRRYIALTMVTNHAEEETFSEKDMYEESCRTLFQLLNICISPEMIEKNMHVLYALVYRKAELDLLLTKNVLTSDIIGRIPAVVSHAHSLLSGDNEFLSAEEAMKELEQSVQVFNQIDNFTNSYQLEEEGFTYLYDEDDEPEIFFLPYIWEVTSTVITAGIIEWDKSRIRVTSDENHALSTQSSSI